MNSSNSSKMLIGRTSRDDNNKLIDVAVETVATAKRVINECDDENKKIMSNQVKQMMNTVYETYPELELPGNILYIYHIQSNLNMTNSKIKSLFKKLLCFFKSMNQINIMDFDSRWASREEFKKILLTNRMFIDHFPNTVEHGLKYFNRNQNYVV